MGRHDALPIDGTQWRRLHNRLVPNEAGNWDQRGRGMPAHPRPAASRRLSPRSHRWEDTTLFRSTERNGGVCTIGSCLTKPGIVTSVVEECRITLDQRHLDASALAAIDGKTRRSSDRRNAMAAFAQSARA